MMGLPNWLRGREGDYDRTQDEVIVPPVARVEHKIPTLDTKGNQVGYIAIPGALTEHEANVVVQAHTFVEQWKASSAAQQKSIEALQIEVTELTLQLESEKRKNGVLEADLATAANTIQSLEIERNEYRQFFSVSLDIKKKELAAMERFGIKPQPKKERKPNAKTTKADKKENRKEKDNSAGTDNSAEKPPTI